MSAEEKIYRNLQVHLDEQTLGFPATKSGSDIRLLKSLFPPDQAEMVAFLTYRFEVKHIIETTTDPIGIVSCVCRLVAKRNGNPCKVTSREETCMLFHEKAVNLAKSGAGRVVSKEEALEILRKNGEEGLVLQPSNTKDPNFICSCCGCCCGILQLQKAIPNPVDYWATNFYATVDSDLCTGCGDCVERCPVNAMQFDDEKGIAAVDRTRCLGCGVCTKDCPVEAITLQNKEEEAIPPKDTEELFEVIVTQKVQAPQQTS